MWALLDAGLRVPQVVTGCQGYLLEHADMLRTLLSRGRSPDVMNWQRQTLLHHVCGQQDPTAAAIDEAAILIDAGANVSARDEEYRSTPLGGAARTNAIDMVKFLLSRGAPTNLPDDELWATPLQWAERRQHQEIAEILQTARGRAAGSSRFQAFDRRRRVSEIDTRSRRPVLDLQTLHLSTVLLVAGHQRQSAGQCVRRNQCVEVADRFAFDDQPARDLAKQSTPNRTVVPDAEA